MNINVILIGQVIWFVLFVIFCMKFVWLFIFKVLEECKQKIVEGLSVVDWVECDLVLVQEKVFLNFKEVKEKVFEIIEQVNKWVNQIVEEVKDQVCIEGECLIEKVQFEIDQEINCVCEELCKEVFVLVLSGVE